MLLSYISFVFATIHRVRIRNLNKNEYLVRRREDVGLTKNWKQPKTDFFVDLPNTRGNIKEVVLFEHVKNKSPRYLHYEKANNRLAFHDDPAKFRFLYHKQTFMIKLQNSDECLHVDKQILLKTCDHNSKNQQFIIESFKKSGYKLKDNSKMEVEVEGTDIKNKDKNVHRDDINIKYDEDTASSEEEDIANRFEDGKEVDFVSEPKVDGDYKVTREVKKEVQEEPALLMRENVSNIIYSTLVTTMTVSSVETVYTTVYQTQTSSITATSTEVIKPSVSAEPKGDEELEPVANIPAPKVKWYKKPAQFFRKKRDDRRAKKVKVVETEVEDVIPDLEDTCKNSNRPECRAIRNFDSHKGLGEKPKISLNKGDLTDEDMLEQPDIADFIKAIPDDDLTDFIGEKKPRKKWAPRLFKREPPQPVKMKNKEKMKHLMQDRSMWQQQQQPFNQQSYNQQQPNFVQQQQFDNQQQPSNQQPAFKQQQPNLVQQQQQPRFVQQPNNLQQPEQAKDEKTSQSGGLLHFVGFNDSIGDELMDSSDDILFGGIHFNI